MENHAKMKGPKLTVSLDGIGMCPSEDPKTGSRIENSSLAGPQNMS